MTKLPEKDHVTVYNVNFYDLDPSPGWRCQAPVHAGHPVIPVAVALCMILISEALARKEIVVHEAHYACRGCVSAMKIDMGVYQ